MTFQKTHQQQGQWKRRHRCVAARFNFCQRYFHHSRFPGTQCVQPYGNLQPPRRSPVSRHRPAQRPGPALECREGVFQQSTPGEYSIPDFDSQPDCFAVSSKQLDPFITCSTLGNTTSASSPGRNGDGNMEAPERSVAVAPRASGQLSRPGPAFGYREGVFQASFTGEYHNSFNLPASDASSDSSTRVQLSCLHSANTPASSLSLTASSSPGRTVDGFMGAPERFVAVAFRANGQLSRPGPAYGCREGVSQTPLSGEYHQPQSEDFPHPHIASLSSPDGPDSPALSIYYQNVRGLRTKVTDFYLAVIDRDYDVVVLTETWLNDDFTTQQLFGDSYNVYWKHRDAISTGLSFGGGVLIAVSRRLTSYPHPLTPGTPLEQL